MDERRTSRVSEALREEISEIISFEMDDPRLLAVKVTEAHVTPDGRHARVRVELGGGEREQAQALAALERARHYLRRELAARMSLRHVPELHFQQDKYPEADARIDFLLKRAKKSRSRAENRS